MSDNEIRVWTDSQRRLIFRDDKDRYHMFNLFDGHHEQTFSASAFKNSWFPLDLAEKDFPEPERDDLEHANFVRDWFGLFTDKELGASDADFGDDVRGAVLTLIDTHEQDVQRRHDEARKAEQRLDHAVEAYMGRLNSGGSVRDALASVLKELDR
ncbi:hypothetical protein SEA_PUPPER_25 [Gordonia phage Pupper]|uniref:Uncharacterized protein n=1 Tax=Gordonia phage Pupper TaxID=2571249 RepID=A0A4Y6EJ60_9CAUD|nr:hypothetical protein KHQ83_gp025 [Gordonia phage Pupper]QDF18512.1 hypothetical protein SEA_PUPPER_25 [Gordonia phage Pupper]QDF18745.1 hypothetical protein SEA_SCENTAE_25 [Gordonia phage SCentae]